jgi:hypothetical protein
MATVNYGEHRFNSTSDEETIAILEMQDRLDLEKGIREYRERLKYGHQFDNWMRQCTCGMFLRDYYIIPQNERTLCPMLQTKKLQTKKVEEMKLTDDYLPGITNLQDFTTYQPCWCTSYDHSDWVIGYFQYWKIIENTLVGIVVDQHGTVNLIQHDYINFSICKPTLER